MCITILNNKTGSMCACAAYFHTLFFTCLLRRTWLAGWSFRWMAWRSLLSCYQLSAFSRHHSLSSPLLSPAAFSFLLVHLSPGNGTASCLGEISNHRDGLAPDRNSPQQPPPRGPKNTGLLKGNGGKRGGREISLYEPFLENIPASAGGR